MKFLIGAAALAAGAIAAPAMAIQPFASFSPTNNVANVKFSNASNQLGTAVNNGAFGGVAVTFHYLQPMLATLGNIDATFTMLASSSQSAETVAGPNGTTTGVEGGFAGTFSFIYSGAAPLVIAGHSYGGSNTPINLLSATFSGATLSGTINGSTGTASDTASNLMLNSSITYTSDFLDFSQTESRDFSMTFVSLTPSLKINANGKFNNFRASASGLESSDPPPLVAAVPEAATWAMMLAGFGVVGASLRTSRRRKDAFAL